MSKQELKELSQLADGEMKTFDLPCGSRITFRRRIELVTIFNHFEVTVIDPLHFVEVDSFDIDPETEPYPQYGRVRLIVLDSAIPTLRAIFGSLSHAAA